MAEHRVPGRDAKADRAPSTASAVELPGRVEDDAEDRQPERAVELDPEGVSGVLSRRRGDALVLLGEDEVAGRVEEGAVRRPSREDRGRVGDARGVGQKEVEVPHRPEPRGRLAAEEEGRSLEGNRVHPLGRQEGEDLGETLDDPAAPLLAARGLEREAIGERPGKPGRVREPGEPRGEALDRRRERGLPQGRRVPAFPLAHREGFDEGREPALGDRADARLREERDPGVAEERLDLFLRERRFRHVTGSALPARPRCAASLLTASSRSRTAGRC